MDALRIDYRSNSRAKVGGNLGESSCWCEQQVNKAVFLDRDGTIIEDADYAWRPEDLRVIAGAFAALKRARELGFRLIVVTNQSGVARGYFSEADVDRFHQYMSVVFAAEGVAFDAIYTCPFHPTQGVEPYRIDSPLRKPKPGMLLQAAADLQIDLSASFMIGDKMTDVAAGRAAGCRTILVATGKGGADAADAAFVPDLTAADIVAAVDWIATQTEANPDHARN